MLRSALYAGALALAAGLLLAMPAKAGDSIIVLAAKPGGNFKPGVSARIQRGDTEAFRLRVDNNSGIEQNVTLDSQPEENARVKWFVGEENISSAVKQGVYEFPLAAAQSRVFRVKITALNNKYTCSYTTGSTTGDQSSALIAVNQGEVICLL